MKMLRRSGQEKSLGARISIHRTDLEMTKEGRLCMSQPSAEQSFLEELGTCLEKLVPFLQQQWSKKDWMELVLLPALGTL